jgi:hypothetical protein
MLGTAPSRGVHESRRGRAIAPGRDLSGRIRRIDSDVLLLESSPGSRSRSAAPGRLDAPPLREGRDRGDPRPLREWGILDMEV